MSTSIAFNAEQLAAARATAWHQDGRALDTLESARNWVDHYGFVLFAPRAQQLGAPAPSFVETTLGAANEAPSAADSATARSLVARLVAEGSVVPLNLLGTAGDQPDFLASAKTFPYVFTMRGDKAWKKAPQTTGPTKVSTLAVNVFEALQGKGAMSAAELASELGREVTETAILRALGELWAQLRVIPQMQTEEKATLWELVTARFSKAVKAGANAGQPTAMSALLSLYLAQAVAATEEQAAGFLSPLTARSRVREVVHALTTGRQLESTVVDGKTLLHVSGELPAFPEQAKPAAEESESGEAPAAKVGTGRIAKFAASAERKPRTDFKGKPAGRTFGGAGRGSSAGPRASRPAGARPDTERRPFRKSPAGAGGAAEKPNFRKPWDEEKRPRRAAAEGEEGAAPRERKPYAAKPEFGGKKPFGERKSFGGGAKSFGERKSFGGGAKTFGERTARPRRDEGGEGSAPRERTGFGARAGAPRSFERKPFAPRDAGGAGERPRRTFDKPGGGGPGRFDRPRGAGGAAGYRKPDAGGGAKRFGGAAGEGGGSRAERPYAKPGSDRPARSYAKPAFDRPSRPRGDGEGPPRFDRAAKPGGFSAKPAFGAKKFGGAKPAFGAKKFGGPKPAFGAGKPSGRAGGFGAKSGSFGAKPGGRPGYGAKPGGFGPKPGAKPGRPFKRAEGGAAPTARKRKPAAEE